MACAGITAQAGPGGICLLTGAGLAGKGQQTFDHYAKEAAEYNNVFDPVVDNHSAKPENWLKVFSMHASQHVQPVCVCVYVCACVRACVRACVPAWMHSWR